MSQTGKPIGYSSNFLEYHFLYTKKTRGPFIHNNFWIISTGRCCGILKDKEKYSKEGHGHCVPFQETGHYSYLLNTIGFLPLDIKLWIWVCYLGIYSFFHTFLRFFPGFFLIVHYYYESTYIKIEDLIHFKSFCFQYFKVNLIPLFFFSFSLKEF